ncbi:unnamed protein product [Closterium sp. NIES-65]|nr:unnamed protein product [Closterium sp. NIES-65]
MERELWGFFDGSEVKPPTASTTEHGAWVKKDKKAFSFLVSKLGLQLVPVVSSCIDLEGATREALRRLENIHVTKSLHGKLQARRNFFTVRIKEGERMRAYVNRVEELGERMVELEADVDEKDWIMTLLGGLGEEWSTVITTLDGTQATWTKEGVTTRLINEEMRWINLKGDSTSSAHFTRGAKKGVVYTKPRNDRGHASGSVSSSRGGHANNNNNRGHAREGACWYCKKPGHWWRECRSKPRDWTPTSLIQEERRANVVTSGEDTKELVFIAGEGALGGLAWLLDTGATQHMTPRAELLEDVSADAHIKRVVFGNQDSLEVEGRGTLRIAVDGGPMTINNVLVVPGLGANLLSVSQLTTKGMRVNIEGAVMTLSTSSGRFIGKAHQDGGIFKLVATPNLASAHAAVAKPSLEMWHNRYGHLSASTIRAMATQGVVHGIVIDSSTNEEVEKCSACLEGKMARKPFPTRTKPLASNPLDLVHTDFGDKPDVSNLRTFGCICYYHVPDATRTKLEAKARVGMYLSHSLDHKGWRVWDLESGKVVVSRDVSFFENRFPTSPKEKHSVVVIPPTVEDTNESSSHDVPKERSVQDEEGDVVEVVGVESEKDGDPSTVVAPTLASTRARRTPRPNPKYADYSLVVEDDEEGEDAMCFMADFTPTTYREAMETLQAGNWTQALNGEYESIIENDVYDLVPLPPNSYTVGSRWVFKKKLGPNGGVLEVGGGPSGPHYTPLQPYQVGLGGESLGGRVAVHTSQGLHLGGS